MTAALAVAEVFYDTAFMAPPQAKQAQAAISSTSGAVVMEFQPVALFVTELRRRIPVAATVACSKAEDGDTYVEVQVPNLAWSAWLCEQMSAVTLDLLRSTGTYVGLCCELAADLEATWPEAPHGVG